MVLAFNSLVFFYLFRNLVLLIIIYFIGVIFNESFFLLFMIVLLINPFLLFLFRENVNLPNIPIKYISPSDGIVNYIFQNSEQVEIHINSNFLCSYIKRSPVQGVIRFIQQEISKSVIEIETEDGILVSLEVQPYYKFSRPIEIYCKVNQTVEKGDRLCFLEFGSFIKLTIFSSVDLLIFERSELTVATVGIADNKKIGEI